MRSPHVPGLRLLILGGTKFLGRHTVDAALAAGHDVTSFTRGRTNPDLFPQVERLRGDRDGDLGALAGREWDAVVDTSGFVPRVVRQSAELLRESVGRYVFVSSISVYDDFSQPVDESSPLGRLEDPASENVDADYGALKAGCEDVVSEVFGERGTSVRAGLLVGPYDPTERFTYWPRRLAEGGDVLAPGEPAAPAQLVDARDLAAWLLQLAEHGPGGAINATGPAEPLTLGGLLERAIRAVGSDARLVWTDEDRLLAEGVQPWTELPLWAPGAEFAALQQTQIGRALAAGLTFRPLEETVRDTLAWSLEAGEQRPTLSREREAALLAGA
jgi:2'-hydroxyisoflavone reductase